MSKFRTQAPWEFLLSASRNTLQSYELSRFGHAANLRKEMTALLDQYLEESTAANLARWLIEQRQRATTASTTPRRPIPPHPTAMVRPITFWRSISFRRRIPVSVPDPSPDFRFGLCLVVVLFAPTLFTAGVR